VKYDVATIEKAGTPEFANQVKSIRNYSSFAKGFMPDGVEYVNGMMDFDGRPAIAEGMAKETGLPLNKALYVGGLASGTTDLSLIPIYVDPSVVDQTRRLTPLVELIPRVTNYGKTADYNRLTARGVVGFRNEDAAIAESDDTIARTSVPMKYFYSVGRVTGQMLAASRAYLSQQYVDALNFEVRNKTISARYIEEDAIINGDVDTTRTAYGGGASIAGAEYDGIRNTITTNASDKTSTPVIDIPMVREAIRVARTANDSTSLGQGDPNMILTDYGTLDAMKADIQEYQKYPPTANFEIGFGIKALEFEGLPVIATKFMPMTSGSREMLVLSLDTWQMRVLQDLTYEELAKTNDSYKFMIKGYEALICTAEMFNTRYYNLT